jgi:hypothetical protein
MNKGKAITRLGLDSQRKSKLIDLLVDQYAAQQDTFDIVRKSGPNGPENGDDILETVSQAYEKNIADFLGQADYSRFQKAIEVGLRENAVEHWIGPQMEMVGAALAPEQLSAMAAIEGTDVAPTSDTIGEDGLAAVDRDRLAKAARILTEAQLAVYRDFLKDRASSLSSR